MNQTLDIPKDLKLFAKNLWENHFVNTPQAIERRLKLKDDFQFRKEALQFWSLFVQDEDGEMSKDQYFDWNIRVSKALLPNFHLYKATRTCEIEYKSDLKHMNGDQEGKSQLTFSGFSDVLFEVVDLWTENSIELQRYISFTQQLFRRITTQIQKASTKASNNSDEDESEDDDEEESPSQFSYITLFEKQSYILKSLEGNDIYNLNSLSEIVPFERDLVPKVVEKEKEEDEESEDEDASDDDDDPKEKKKKEPQPVQPPEDSPMTKLLKCIPGGTRPVLPCGPKLPLFQLVEEFPELSTHIGVQLHAKPPIIFVVGKPGTGKTTLATKVAAAIGSIHIDVEQHIKRLIDLRYSDLFHYLAEGNLIDEKIVFKILTRIIHTEEHAYRGFVLDGFPSNLYQLTSIQKWSMLFQPDFIIELSVDDEDAVNRLANFKTDPVTQTHFPGAKISEWLLRKCQPHEIDDEEQEEPKIPLNDVIYERLVISPESNPANIRKMLTHWSTNFESIRKSLLAMLDSPYKFINIDATQNPDVVFQHALEALKCRGNLPTVIQPVIFGLPANVSAETDHTQLRNFLRIDSEDGIYLNLSEWTTHCPVTFHNTHCMVRGKVIHCVRFRNQLFLMKDQGALREFMKNPLKFTSIRPHLPTHIRLVLVGPPLSGKTTQAQLISQYLGIPHIHIDDLIKSHILEGTEVGLQAFRQLSAGQAISSDLIFNILDQAFHYLNTQIKQCPENEYGHTVGWILDGIPRKQEEVEYLLDKNIIPTHVVVLEDDTEGDQLLRRISPDPSRPLDVLHYPFDSMIDQYHETHEAILSNLLQAMPHSAAKFINCNGSATDTFGHILKAINPLFVGAASTEVDESDAPSPVPTSAPKAEDGQTEPPVLEFKSPKWFWGAARHYCIVSFTETGCLIPGKEEFVASYEGYLYTFGTEQHQNRFIANPYCYITKFYQMKHKIPNPKLMVFGHTGSRKDQLCAEMCNQHQLKHIQFSMTRAWSSYLKLRARLKENDSDEDEVSPELLFMNELLEEVPVMIPSDGGYIIEVDVKLNAAQLGTLFTKNKEFIPESVIVLSITEELAVSRLASQISKQEFYEDDEENEATKKIIRTYSKESKNLEDVQELCSEWNLPAVEISDTMKISVMHYKLTQALPRTFTDRESIFSYTIPLGEECQELVEKGVLKLSKFGLHCPVSMQEESDYVPIFLTRRYPCLYKQQVYYTQSINQQVKFLNNPEKYVTKPPKTTELPFSVGMRCFVLGKAKSGRTTLSKILARDLQINRITVSKVLRTIIQAPTVLGRTIDTLLRHGEILSDEIVVRAIHYVFNTYQIKSKGWVLDGFPITLKQLQLLNQHGIIPNQVFWLELSDELSLDRAKSQKEQVIELSNIFPQSLHTEDDGYEGELNHSYSAGAEPVTLNKTLLFHQMEKITKQRNQSVSVDASSIQKWCKETFNNLHIIDAMKNKWSIYSGAEKILKTNLKQQHLFVIAEYTEEAASLQTLCISRKDFQDKLAKSPFGNYCPVNLVEQGELHNSPPPGEDYLKNACIYQGVIYRFEGPKQLDQFLLNPNVYTSKAELLPKVLPRPLSLADQRGIAGNYFQFHGYCPVTFFQTLEASKFREQYEGLVKGQNKYAVEYDGKMYAMATEQQQTLFLRNPEKYINIQFPKRLPAPPITFPLEKLPIMGFLEQAVAEVFVKGLRELIHFKPKYPKLSAKESVLMFLSIYLKAYNPKNNSYVTAKYKKKLEVFKKECSVSSEVFQKTKQAKALHQIPIDETVKIFDEIFNNPTNLEKFVR